MSPSDEPTVDRALLDTSVFIAREAVTPIRCLPGDAAVSVATLAELTLGVLMADDPSTRAVRLHTLSVVEAGFDPIPIDQNIARVFAEIVAEARRLGRRPGIMDSWIAATAVAKGVRLFTQDKAFQQIPRVQVVLV